MQYAKYSQLTEQERYYIYLMNRENIQMSKNRYLSNTSLSLFVKSKFNFSPN